MKISLVIISLFLSSLTLAQADMKEFREGFKEVEKLAEEKFKISETLRPLEVEVATEVDEAFCRSFQERVVLAYSPINPFYFNFGSGLIGSKFCLEIKSGLRFFYEEKAGINSFGVPYSFVFKQVYEAQYVNDGWRDVEYTIYFTDKLEIVEINKRGISKKNNLLLTYEVSAFDHRRDYFSNIFTQITAEPKLRIEGLHKNIYRYSAHDGSTPGAFEKRTSRKIANPSEVYEQISLSKPDRSDWDSHTMPLTFAWVGGLYYYKTISGYVSDPFMKSTLIIKTQNSKEGCAFGEKSWIIQREDGALVMDGISYPIDKVEYSKCRSYPDN